MRLIEITAFIRDCSKRQIVTRNKVEDFLEPGYFTKQVWRKAAIT